MAYLSVLVVDGNAIFLRIAVRFLEERYADEVAVVGAATGMEEALAFALSVRPHAVLLGLGFSMQHDLQLIPRLRSGLPEVLVVVMGTLDSEAYRQSAVAAGADAYIAKDALQHDFLPALGC